MVGTLEHYDSRPSGVRAGNLDRVLHRFGSTVGQQGFLGKIAGGQPIEHFGQFHMRLVVGHHRTHVNQFGSLFLDGVYHPLWRVAHRKHANAPSQVNQHISVQVFDQCAVSAFNRNGNGLGHCSSDRNLTAGVESHTGWTGYRGFELNVGHGKSPLRMFSRTCSSAQGTLFDCGV